MSTVRGYNLLLLEYPHGTHDIPLMYHDIPPPHGTQITKDDIPPTVLMNPPRY